MNDLGGKSKKELVEIVQIQMDEYQKLQAENAKLKAEPLTAYVVTYMSNTMGVFFSEQEADDYSDRFGGVYGVEPVNVKYAVERAVQEQGE